MTQFSHIDPATLGSAIDGKLSSATALGLRDFPEIPLALKVPMPKEMGFEHGDVGMAFHQLTLTAQGPAKVSFADDGALDVAFGALTLNGVYRMAAKKAVLMDLDVGGTLMEADPSQPAGAGEGDDDDDPFNNEEMLDQARAQRTKLRETPNGQVMLDTFNEHNETYNTVFVTRSELRNVWRAGGATKGMATDTSTAVSDDGVVNSKDAKYFNGSGNVTYNGNAFSQNLNLTVATMAMQGNLLDPNFKIDPNSKYTKASLAALTFQNGVQQTGNDKDNVNELTATGVYGQVKTGTQPAPATEDQLQNAIVQGLSGGGGAAEAEARANNWRVLDEEDRAQVRRMVYAIEMEKAEQRASVSEPMWSGGISSLLRGVTACIEKVDLNGSLQTRVTVTLPAFEVDLDDARWTGEAVEVLRARLRDMYFVRRMLQEAINSGLRDMLQDRVLAV